MDYKDGDHFPSLLAYKHTLLASVGTGRLFVLHMIFALISIALLCILLLLLNGLHDPKPSF